MRVSFPPALRVALMILIPLILFMGPLPKQVMGAPDAAQAVPPPGPDAVAIAPPTNLQLLSLDTSIHASWSPSTDSTTVFHMVSVWEGSQLQQSKVVSRTAGSAQANGVLPGHTYTVRVHAMDAQGGLSTPITGVAITDPQSPMINAAFFENFNGPHGDLDANYFDVRTSQGSNHRPDVQQANKFLVFNSERHFHTQMIGGLERGELYIRNRVPMDLPNSTMRTFQTEFDISSTQHSEGKWPEIHFVDAAHVPWSSEEFGAGDGDDWSNSITFSARGDNGGSTSNLPIIEANINGVQTTYRGTTPIFTPVNIRLPVVIKINRVRAELYINGTLAVAANFSSQLPFTQGYWMLAHRSWYSGRDRVSAPVINQVVHWDMMQFDGPTGSINPTARVYIQPGCPSIIHNNNGVVQGCQVISLNRFQRSYTMPFSITDDVSRARSAVLRINGTEDNGALDFTINGNPMTINMAGSGYQNVLNSMNIPVSMLQQGANSLVFTSDGAEFSQVELEVVYNIPRTPVVDPHTGPVSMLQVTNNNFRVDHLNNDPDIYTATTNMYNIGGTQAVPYTVEVLNPRPYLTLSPTSGTLISPSYGGGVTPLNMRFNFAGVSTDDDGDVIVVRVNGGIMPIYIGIMVVAAGANNAPPFVTSFPLTTSYNKNAIPDYHGGVAVTGTPTRTTTPTLTTTPTPLPSGCEAVVWGSLVNATATGNNLQKTGGVSSTWDAGAASTRAIQSGNGYAYVTADDTSTYKLFGLSNGNTGAGTTDVDFALYMAGGALKVYENGVLRANVGSYVVGDILKVAVESGVVKYYRNGTLLYTSTAQPIYPLALDAAINSSGARITNAYICGANLGSNATFTPITTVTPTSTAIATSTSTLTNTPIPTFTVTLTRTPTRTNTQTSTNTSTPTNTPVATSTPTPAVCGAKHYLDPEPGAPANGGTVTVGDRFVLDMRVDAGNYSDITAQQAYMTYTYQLLHNARVSSIDTSCVPTNTVTIDTTILDAALQNEVCDGPNPCTFRGVQINPGSIAFASGAIGTCPDGCGGDFRVARVGFCAYAPGQAIIHWQFAPPAPITRDTEIVSLRSNIVSVPACYVDYVVNIVASTPTSTPAPVCQQVVWTNPINVTGTFNSIQKTGGTSSTWDAGASSTSSITSGNGYAYVTADDTSTYKLFGLNNSDTNATQTDVDFALYMAGGALKVYESGVLKANVGTYAVGDVLKVAVEGSAVKYYRNGSLLYTSATAPTYPLVMDTSINSMGARITNAYICR